MGRILGREIPEFAKLIFRQGEKQYEFVQSLISVSRKKIIVATSIPGENGTVKEIIGADDYEISIVATITGENGAYPSDNVNQLIDFLNSKTQIDVISSYLNNVFGIYSIIVENYSMPQTAGGISKQEFTISAISEDPIILQMQ
jgi:Domain of unknown function (DUF6046)